MIPRGIGLLGGTFDPVHSGHLALARAARDALGLARVDFLPAGNPWQKDLVSPAHVRLAMLELAIAKMPGFRVEPIELMRFGATYTVETLRALRRRLGPSIPLVLILGGDQWRNLHTWRNWRSLADHADLAVCRRAGEPLEAVQEVSLWSADRMTTAEKLTESAFGRIAVFDMAPHGASATAIRRAMRTLPYARAMQALDGWLPIEVAGYIRAHGLYGAR
ncbi:nicotinate (nicotinamide) nucleotide adenylyltransferase [Sutterella sp.]|uniref:nicotinate (nicotinamide) nucleotide adenylyltransferase n=1 Tax=Sutterella sp. TaxID=1981025 RepID=UPI0026DEC13F|nr:nicotinate (nicotinamide) nucleotide adenylyltransferase [Sutterella sp.]MDO5530636.1 nicotinate (nicotinamide) nucleotide adenylyltransferase [Sutterella sp.]